MPYRRLPNTDAARLKALKTALSKGSDIPPFKLAFSQGTLTRIQALLPNYEHALSEHRNAYNLHIDKGKDYNKSMKKARLYISHFIQVINMAMQRGELPESTRACFNMEEYDKKLPSLHSQEEIIAWYEILTKGEQERRNKGMSPITNPTIAVVKVHCDTFLDACNFQEGLKVRLERAQSSLAAIRDEADAIIQALWNEVE